jgi:hypothetical protein
MKQLTERDKTLAMLLPAFAILLGYGLFVLRGKAGDVKRTNDALAKAKAPSAAEIGFQRAEAAQAMQETQGIEAKLAALQKKWSYETAFCAAGTQSHDRVEKLTSLLKKHRLTPLENAEGDSANKDTKVSASLESMLKKIADQSAGQKPQLRRIRFYGRFVDVHDALEELAQGPVLAIPVGLSMKQASSESNLREWTLLVWL